MAKQPPNKTTAIPVTAPAPVRNTGHPMLKNKPQSLDIGERLLNRQKGEEFKIEEIDKWKLSINKIAATAEGKALFRALISHADLFAPAGSKRDTVKMVEDKCKIDFYLTWVRPYLDRSLRGEIE